MFSLNRASFRQLLVIGFLLIAALLAAVALQGLVTLERLMAQSREGADRAVQMNGAVQTLIDRSVTMERAARQYLVLDDTVLRDRFEAAARSAGEVLAQLVQNGLPPQHAASWHARREAIGEQLVGPRSSARQREETLTVEFAELDAINTEISQYVRQATEARNRQLVSALEASRLALGRQAFAAMMLAVFLALGFGLWLARPLKRLERAIVGLGENRLDQPIETPGPADIRLLGRRLDWLRLRLAELDADKARFLRHVSHELKTPLAALREGVALLEEGVAGTLTESQREIARILRQNTVVLQGQIEDLLRFNAAAFEARRLVRKPTELSELVGRLVEEQRLQWQARHLHVDVRGGPVWVEVDPEKFGVALGNLLSNAIRFSPPGGTIDIRLSRAPNGVRVDIADQGPGVAPADRERVFEPFYRGERQPGDAVRGTGLGLSIVHEYIAAHGGRIELMPTEPGARFRIDLPHATQD
jgi:two-component system sensor histidine kinase GlrK